MSARARSETVQLGEVAAYHCWNRCVRGACLCGKDPITGSDYEYRRDWICEAEEQLAGLFGVEVGFRAELVNHVHLILRTRPDVVEEWSDRDVVRRWLTVTKLAKSRDGKLRPPTRAEIKKELARSGRVAVLRQRLSDPSYFMGTLCEYIARRSNREDNCSGVFWEDRYGCRNLADEGAILICGIYVDLNQIRAGETTTPESSTHTSAYNRIQSRQLEAAESTGDLTKEGSKPKVERPDGWLCELTLDECEPIDGVAMLRSKDGRRASDKGLLSISLDHYLQLLDFSGRTVRTGKAGSIPGHLAPILDRLGIRKDMWFDVVTKFDQLFGHIVGRSDTIVARATQAGKKTYRGRPACAAVFA